MANIFDVASYILSKAGAMTAMKLEKLAYYAQAWSLVWDEAPLFEEEFEAWAGGPVSPPLYERHRGQFMVTSAIVPDGDQEALNATQRDTIDQVLSFYGGKTAQWLSDLTHMEAPWVNARERAGAPPGGFCRETITLADMAEYYAGLMATNAEAVA